MYILVSGATKTVERYKDHPNLGQLITPHDGNKIRCDVWAADNAAYSNWDRKAWLKMLRKINNKNPKFVVAPDVVGHGRKTLKRLKITSPMIKKRNLPVAYVLQNGCEGLGIRWYLSDAVFIGGDDDFKLGQYVRHAVQSAKDRGAWVHMGRVNSLKRLQYAFEIGCDSVDGSGYSMFPDQKIPKALRFLEMPQMPLFGYIT